MKRIFFIVLILAVNLTAHSFVVEVSDIPEAVKKFPLTIVSDLDNTTLDSIQPEGTHAILHGTIDKTERCSFTYSFDIEHGVRSNNIPIFLGEGNDTVRIRFKEDYENYGVYLSGGELNDRKEAIWKNSNNLQGNEKIEYVKNQVLENISNPLGAYLLSLISRSLDPNIWLDIYQKLPTDLAKYPVLVKSAEKIIAAESTKEGQMFQDMPCLTPEGKEVNLSDYLGKGKYVLLDFLAYWCGPCRKEAKEVLTPLYEKYKDNPNFSIIGIMTSDSVEKHLEALKTLKYPWQQLIDSERVADKKFGFDFIPCIMLIGPDGRILKRNIRGEEIWKSVENALAK